MYKKSKRFLAGFLAFLLVVTMVPSDMLSVVYAEEAEEIESQVLEDTDNDAVLENAEEAEVLEITEPEENTEEALEGNDNLKEGESETPSQQASAPAPSQPTITPEPSQPVITPEPSQQASEPASDPQPVNDDKEAILDVGKSMTVGSNLKSGSQKVGIFTVDFTSTGDANAVATGTYTYKHADGSVKNFTGRLTIAKGGNGKITFTPKKSGTLVLYALKGGDKGNRTLLLKQGNNEIVQFDTTAGGIETSDESASPKLRYFTQKVEASKEYVITNSCTNGGIYIYYLAVEYDPEPVDLSEATISVKVKDKDNKEVASPKYTGEAYKIETTVTDKDGKPVASNRYTVSYERKGTDNSWTATTDLTGAGTIRVKVDKLDSGFTTNSTTSDEIVIAKENLEAEDKTINHSPEETGNKEYDIAALFAETAGANTLSYALDTTVNGYDAGNVIENPTVADGKLTYSIVSPKPASITPAVLGIKVTSDNYNEKTFKITINVKEKTPVTIKLESKTHTYNGQKYGFKDNVVITEVTGTGITEANKQEAIDDLMENLSYKYQAEGGQAVSEEPTDAGTYTVTAELASESAYTLSSSATSATLTISAKPIKLKANNVEWDKALDPMPVSGRKATADDYKFVAVSEGEENIGLVSGDSLAEEPTIKYCKKDTTDEMTEADWKALGSTDTVDIVLSDADSGKNYEITACEKGTLTTLIRTAEEPENIIPDAGATLTSANMEAVSANPTTVTSTDRCFIFTADAENTITVDKSKSILKTDGLGSPFYRSIGFKVSKPAKVEVTAASANSSSVRPVVLGKVNDDNTVTTISLGYVAKDPVALTPVVVEEAGTYYIYSVKGCTAGTDGGMNFTQVKVTYDGVVVTPKVSVTPSISDEDTAKLQGAKVYFTASGETDIPVTSGTAVQLKQGKEYTLQVKDAPGGVTLTAKIGSSTKYTPAAADDGTTVTITIEETTNQEYDIHVATNVANAEVTTGSKTAAPAGETIKLSEVATVTTATGYKLNGWTVTTATGTVAVTNDATDGYVFTMPAEEVTVTPVIVSDGSSETTVAMPVVVSPAGTQFGPDGDTVKLSCATQGAKIYYTLDGSTPTAASSEYTDAGIKIEASLTLKAIAVLGDKVSGILEVSYKVLSADDVFAPEASVEGAVRPNTTVTLTCVTEGATIYYTTDGTTPSATSTKYEEPIKITKAVTIKAIAIKDGKSSEVATFSYTIQAYDNSDPTVKKISITECKITVPSYIENRKITRPVTYVTYYDEAKNKTVTFTEGLDYEVSDPVKADDGSYSVKFNGLNRTEFGRSVDKYQIEKLTVTESSDPRPVRTYKIISTADKKSAIDVSKAKIALDKNEIKNLCYTGYAHEPKTLVYTDKNVDYKALADNNRLQVVYKNNINAGKATVTISVLPDTQTDPDKVDTNVYVGSKTLTFTIKKAALGKTDTDFTKGAVAIVDLPKDDELKYTNKPIYAKKIQVVTADGKVLKQDTDYTVTYKNNAKAGKATVTIKGVGNNLSGSTSRNYTITGLELTGYTAPADKQGTAGTIPYSPQGARLGKLVLVDKDDATKTLTLTEDVDFTAKYTYEDKKTKAVDSKIKSVVIKGKNGCKGQITVTGDLTIGKANFDECVSVSGAIIDSSITDAAKFQKALEKAVVVTDTSGKKLKIKKDYVIEAVTASDSSTSYVVKPSETTKANYKSKETAEGQTPDPTARDPEITVSYVTAANLAKDKKFVFDKNFTLTYDGRNPVEITQDEIDKISGYTGAEGQTRTYILGTNIEIVPGTYKNNIKKGSGSVTVRGIATGDGKGFYGTKVLKFKIVEG